MVSDNIKREVEEHFTNREKNFVPGESQISVADVSYDSREVLNVLDSLYAGQVSSGPKAAQFEEDFAKYIGTEHAISVNSGSSANLLAYEVLMQSGNIKKGDEVIVPAATFPTVVSPIMQLGLVPRFVDVKEDSFNIDPEEIEKAVNDKTKVIMPVHSLGWAADMDKILEIAKRHNLKVVEDCCEAHGAEYKGRKVGTFGDFGTFSFFVAHNMTTGDGGMIVTNNSKYVDKLKSLKAFGRALGKPEFDDAVLQGGEYDYLKDYHRNQTFLSLGYNMRMTDLQAGFGIEQLKKLNWNNGKRRETAAFFTEKLKEFEKFIQLPNVGEDYKHVYYGYPIIIRKGAGFSRKELEDFLRERKVDSRPFFGGCLPDQPAFKGQKIEVQGELPVSRWIRDYCIFIGVHPEIGEKEREYVVSVFREFFREFTQNL